MTLRYIIDWIDDGWVPEWLPTVRPTAIGEEEDEASNEDVAPEAALYQLNGDDEYVAMMPTWEEFEEEEDDEAPEAGLYHIFEPEEFDV